MGGHIQRVRGLLPPLSPQGIAPLPPPPLPRVLLWCLLSFNMYKSVFTSMYSLQSLRWRCDVYDGGSVWVMGDERLRRGRREREGGKEESWWEEVNIIVIYSSSPFPSFLFSPCVSLLHYHHRGPLRPSPSLPDWTHCSLSVSFMYVCYVLLNNLWFFFSFKKRKRCQRTISHAISPKTWTPQEIGR